MSKSFFLSALALTAALALQAREVHSLNDGWTFIKGFVKTGPVAGTSFGRGPQGEPVTVHLCSREYTDRQESVTDIIVFTTAPAATLYLNGKKVSQKKADAYATVEWPAVQLQKGENRVRIVTAQGEDSAVWTVW